MLCLVVSVGLGDFFLPPEVLFLHDTMLFSFIFLGGFTFFAAFLSSLSGYVLGSLFPDAGRFILRSFHGEIRMCFTSRLFLTLTFPLNDQRRGIEVAY